MFGTLVAWVLVRYEFPGKGLANALVDLPFALPTAVTGIALAALYAPNGWIGRFFEPLGIKIAFTPVGIWIALVVVSLPFIVRAVQPVLEELSGEYEEAAATLGANRFTTFRRVLLPEITPALLTGAGMMFARATGEYGSVIFIAGSIPMISEILPLIITGKLEQFDAQGASAVALFMLLVSFVILFALNVLQWAITIQNLNKKRFGNFHALKNINLNVPAGKLVSLLGPSGCGKTTLLRIIAGLENADGGQILFGGQDVTAKHVRERKVGFVFQHYALFRHMNVFDNVAFGLTVLPKPERPSKGQIRAKVEELLKLVQLSHLAKSYPHQLSGGQRQRIALARALAVEPKLLLLDEPFGALDAKVRKELRTWLRDIHHNLGVTSILVTHDQEEALEVSDEIVVMNHGKIEQTGSAEAIYRKPENAFVTEFLGEADAFEGRIEKGIWHYNGFAWKLDAQYKWQEQTATGYIRPHEWQIAAEHETPMIRAEIEKIHAVGALTHVLVKHGKQDVHITLAGSDAARYPIAEGKKLNLIPKQVYVFSQNELIEYSI